MKKRKPSCDLCYGKKTEDCPKDCVNSHIRYVQALEGERQ